MCFIFIQFITPNICFFLILWSSSFRFVLLVQPAFQLALIYFNPSYCSVAVASRFQSTFLKLLHDAEFEELSARDLLLTSALNTDYLLTLPINIDWKRASESNAIIFRSTYLYAGVISASLLRRTVIQFA